MTTDQNLRLQPLLAALVVALLCTAAQAELRTWTAAGGGYTVEAEYLGVKPGDVVQLRTKDGRTIEVPLAQLSQADRDYAKRRQASGSMQLAKVQREADRCRTPDEVLIVFKVFHDDPATAPADKAYAAAQIEEMKKLAAAKMVRLNKKWVSADAAAAVRKQADELMRQGLELLKLGKEDAFKQKFGEASKLEPEEIRADFLAATIYTLARAAEKAMPIYQRCLVRDPDNILVLNNIAICAGLKGDYVTVQSSWRKALSLQVDQRVMQNVGRFLALEASERDNALKAAHDSLSVPYAEIIGSGKAKASDPEIGWLLLLIEESDLDINPGDDDEEETKSVRPETTEDGEVVGGGTGFVIHPGYVITNAHVADDDGTFEIQAPDGKLLKAVRVAKADKADLALLKCEELAAPPLTFAKSLAPRGSDVMLLGFPEMFSLGATLKATRGSISSVPDSQINDMYLYDAVTNSGNSGGPVCDNCGNVVAVHAAGINTASRYGGGVPSLQALEFLKQALPEAQSAEPSTAKLDWPQVDAKVSPSTVLIWVRKKHGAGPKTEVGGDLVELPFCIPCGGYGKFRCGLPGCNKGIVTRGKLRATCPVCNGAGIEECDDCGGAGLDVKLASVQRALARAGVKTDNNNSTERPTTPTTTSTPAPSTSPPRPSVSSIASGDRAALMTSVDGGLQYDPGAPPNPQVRLSQPQLSQAIATLRGGNIPAARQVARDLYNAVPDPSAAQQVAAALESCLSNDPAWALRCDCLRALTIWRGPNTANAVANSLRDSSWVVRRAAAFNIALSGDPRPIPQLVESLRNPKNVKGGGSDVVVPNERKRYKQCLIVFGSSARDAVLRIENDSDPEVASAVQEILGAYDAAK